MLPRGWELLLKGALEDSGLIVLPPAERQRVGETLARRLELHGVRPELHNWGGVLCGRVQHNGCCTEIDGRRMQRFADDVAGTRRLVELCCIYTGAKAVEGFRSELRSEGFFGPSEEAEKTFQELSAAWAGLEAEFGAAKLKGSFTRASYETWLAFRDKWRAADADTTALPAMVAEVNLTRQNLGKERADIRPPDVTQTTAALKTLATVDSAAKSVTSFVKGAASDAWGAVPVSVKIGAAVVAVLGALFAVYRMTPRHD